MKTSSRDERIRERRFSEGNDGNKWRSSARTTSRDRGVFGTQCVNALAAHSINPVPWSTHASATSLERRNISTKKSRSLQIKLGLSAYDRPSRKTQQQVDHPQLPQVAEVVKSNISGLAERAITE